MSTTITRSAHVEVAETIIGQIGYSTRFAIGAREFLALDEKLGGVRIKVNRGQYVKVVLNGSDLYDVTFIRPKRGTHGTETITISERSGVYAEDLGKTLYDLTQRNQ